MKSLVRNTKYKILKSLPLKNIIIFESNPDFACNTFPVFEEIYNSEWAKDWKFVWICKKRNSKLKLPNVKCVLPPKYSKFPYINTLIREFYIYRAKCIISCNTLIAKCRDEQLAIFLSHGSKIKKTRGICEIGDSVDYVSMQSHFFDDAMSYEYNLKKEKFVYLGYPRNDYFFKENVEINKKLGIPENAKYMIWLPTFRKAKSGRIDATSSYDNIGIPILYNTEMLKSFNDFLKSKNVFVVYKPHPAQDISVIKASSLSNLLIVDDEHLASAGLQLYEVIGKSEALITDYSSVFFDYVLLDKPIGTTTDDMEEWKQGRGFAYDIESIHDKCTERIVDFEGLTDFVTSVAEGKDDKHSERQEIAKLTNMYFDGQSAKRTVDFILQVLAAKFNNN